MTKKKYLIKNQKLFQKKKNKSKKNQKKNKTSKKKQRKTKKIISKIIKKSNNKGKKTRIKKKNNKLFNLKGGLGKCYIETENLPTLIESIAPESYSKGEFSTASDVWSLGLTFWEIFYNDSKFGFQQPFYHCETDDVQNYFGYLTNYVKNNKGINESPDKVNKGDLINNKIPYESTHKVQAADWFKEYVFVEGLDENIKTLFKDCLKINRTNRKAASQVKDIIRRIMRQDIQNIFPQRDQSSDTGTNKGYTYMSNIFITETNKENIFSPNENLVSTCESEKIPLSNLPTPHKRDNRITITRSQSKTYTFLSQGEYSVTELSQGNFGKVFKIEKTKASKDGKPNELVYKILMHEEGENANDEAKLIWNEYVIGKILSNLDSNLDSSSNNLSSSQNTDNVVRCYGSDEGNLNFGYYGYHSIKIFMEFAPYGNIPSFFKEHLYNEMSGFYRQYIKAKEDVSIEQTILKIKLRMCWDITNGIEFLHDQYFIHNDIGSRNVMVFKSPTEHQIPIICKIGDFGKTVQLEQ